MLQDNPYGYNSGSQDNNSASSAPPPPPVVPPNLPTSPSTPITPPTAPPTTPLPPPPNSPSTYVPPQPPPIINPLNDLHNMTLPEESSYKVSSIPPISSLDLREDAKSTGVRKPPNKKMLLVVMVILLLLGIVGGGTLALISGLIPNPFASETAQVPSAAVPEEQLPPPVESPQEEAPAPEPIPVQSNDDIRVADINVLATGLNSYGVAHANVFPSTDNQLIHINPFSSPCMELLAENFVASCPTDPIGESSFYGYKSDGVSFELTAKLDDSSCSRPGAVFTGSICLFGVKGGSIIQ